MPIVALGVARVHDDDGTLEGAGRTRPPSRTASPTYDDTASSPSTSLLLPTTTGDMTTISDDFLEVLSSRLLNAIAKKQRQLQSEGSTPDAAVKPRATPFAGLKSTAATGLAACSPGATAAYEQPVNCAAMNSYSEGDQSCFMFTEPDIL